MHSHQLHSVFERPAAEVGRRQRRHRIVLSAILSKASTRLAKQLHVLQKFAQRSLPHQWLGFAAPLLGQFLQAPQRERIRELEYLLRNFHRRSQQVVGVGEVVSRLAHRFHHREATGYFLQHRLDGSLLGSEGERSAKLFRSEERRVGKEGRSRWSPY